jgi:thiol-disulfide isomerase/thioredoxin
MFPVLLRLCTSEWWPFDPDGLAARIENTPNIPLFILCFSPHCHYCHGKAENLQKMAESTDFASPVTFTAINCSLFRDSCNNLKVGGYPWFGFARAPEPRYWEHPGYHDPEDWISYVRRKLETSVVDFSQATGEDVNATIAETLNGATIFQMVISNEDRLASSQFDLVSKKWEKETHARFLFNNTEQGESLTASLGPACQIFAPDLENVSSFVDANRFRHFHRYTFEECESVRSYQNIALLFTQGTINSSELALLGELSQTFCGRFTFGWVPIGHSFKILGNFISGDQNTGFVGAITPEGCKAVYRDGLAEPGVVDFISQVLEKKAEWVKSVLNLTRGGIFDAKPRGKGATSLVLGVLILVAVLIVAGVVLFPRLRRFGLFGGGDALKKQ